MFRRLWPSSRTKVGESFACLCLKGRILSLEVNCRVLLGQAAE